MDRQDKSDFLKTANAVFEENNRLTEKCQKQESKITTLEKKIKTLSGERPLFLEIGTPDGNKVPLGLSHHSLPKVLKSLECGLNVYLYGPSGSGKTFAAGQCAKALGVPLHFTGAISNEYKLTGYMDAKGNYVTTEFRKAYENGGLFLFDEIDGSFPQAVLAFNAALANDYMDFPDKQVRRHEKFYCIAAANTIGLGANRQYVGRNQLDAASLDRFVFVEWNYDESMERRLTDNDDWFEYVVKVRKTVSRLNLRYVISPRASLYGSKLLSSQEFSIEEVENMVLWKGMDDATIAKIKEYIKPISIVAGKNGICTLKEAREQQRYSYTDLPAINFKNNDAVKEGDVIMYLINKDGYLIDRIKAPADGIISFCVREKKNVAEGDIVAKIERI